VKSSGGFRAAFGEHHHRRDAGGDCQDPVLEPAEQRHAHRCLPLGSARGAHHGPVDSRTAVREEAPEARGDDGEPVGVAQVVGPILDSPDPAVAEVVAGEGEGDEAE
jgi:hypothetical protein